MVLPTPLPGDIAKNGDHIQRAAASRRTSHYALEDRSCRFRIAELMSRLTSLNVARVQFSSACDEGHAAVRLAGPGEIGNWTLVLQRQNRS
jgi:hypothetical protein